MARVENSITIQVPIEKAFAFMADYANASKWQIGVLASGYISPEPYQAGSTFKFDAKFMGRKMETTGVLTAYESPHQLTWKSTSGPFPMSGATTFESVPGGTVVKDIMEAEPGGFFKLAEPLLIKQYKDKSSKDLQKLKALLEG